MNMHSQMIKNLLTALIDEWMIYLTFIEIGSDQDKVQIMLDASAFIKDPITLHTYITDLYLKVFLRNIWNDK